MYRFNVGQRIKYLHDQSIRGNVLKLVSFDEEEGVRVDVENADVPWYDILWDDERGLGFEHDESLVPGE